jgi:protein-S-isoprenylcysteine O-methyltransferase Ste14
LYAQEELMFILVRAVAYATLFVGFLFIALPQRVLAASGVGAPAAMGAWQIAGLGIGTLGAILGAACILTFVFVGRGTQAPFDPPRALVASGPYTFLRNPMYLGGAAAMAGAALYYQSWALLAYVITFVIAAHLFVVAYEEPTLRRVFGRDYDAYCARTRRWGIV